MNNPLFCEDCGWMGKEEVCRTYRYGEMVYECPKCGSKNLVELSGNSSKLQFVPA